MCCKSKISDMNLYNERVFLRADLNVPFLNDQIQGDDRLRKLKPTLDNLVNQGARIILATHIGRPKYWDKSLSTQLLLPWFERNGYVVTYASDIYSAKMLINQANPGSIIILENIRFDPREQEYSLEFAQQLKALADYYINDAFGLLHRRDTSITLLPKLFNTEHKTIGFLIEKELNALQHLKQNSEKPFMVILGGSKIYDKILLLESFLHTIDILLLCPATVFTFLKSLGEPVGKSLVENNLLEKTCALMHNAQKLGIKVLVPVDYLVVLDTLDGPFCYAKADNFPSNGWGISIGQETQELYKQEILKAKTIFFNGAMGLRERPCSYQGLYSLLQAIAQSSAYSVIGGGGSVAAVHQYGFESAMTFCSTGGGATLAYLSSHVLPGLTYI